MYLQAVLLGESSKAVRALERLDVKMYGRDVAGQSRLFTERLAAQMANVT